MSEAPAASPRRLAVFDLDGTLSRRDTFLGFVLGLLAEQPGRWIRLPLLALPLAGYLVRALDRGAFKGAILHLLFGGLPRSTIEAFAIRYAASVVSGGMFGDALTAFRGHLAAGDRVVLLSASPDLYVPEIGRQLGAHTTICTGIRWNGDRLDGRLAGPNRRGEEKLHVLEGLRAQHPGLPVTGYGNSGADLAHLQRCEEAWYVNPHPRLAAIRAVPGLKFVRWH